MSKSLPTIVFFPGAFTQPSCFDSLSAILRKSGYPTVYTEYLTSNPSNPISLSTAQDADKTRKSVLVPLIEAGKEIVVFTHSYGGIVGAAAACGLSKKDRARKGKSGGVMGLIYLAGNIAAEGESLLQNVGGAYPDWIKQNNPSKGLAVIAPVMEILYNDIPSTSSLVPQLEAAMTPHALSAFETPSEPPAWQEEAFDGRRAYIRTLDDQTNPLFAQDLWIEKTGVKWEVRDIKAGHCPFVHLAEETAELVQGIVKSWA